MLEAKRPLFYTPQSLKEIAFDLGFVPIKALASKPPGSSSSTGSYVYLGSRDAHNGQQAVNQLKAEGLDQVEPLLVDVSASIGT